MTIQPFLFQGKYSFHSDPSLGDVRYLTSRTKYQRIDGHLQEIHWAGLYASKSNDDTACNIYENDASEIKIQMANGLYLGYDPISGMIIETQPSEAALFKIALDSKPVIWQIQTAPSTWQKVNYVLDSITPYLYVTPDTDDLNYNFTQKSVMPGLSSIQASKSAKNLDFSFIDLTKADFSQVDCTGATFGKAILTHAKFNNANLTSCCFNEATLDHTTFDGATLDQATFIKADISKVAWGVIKSGKKMDLSDCHGELMVLSNDQTLIDCTEAILRGGNFTKAILDWLKLDGADLTGATLTDASCQHASLQRATLQNTDMIGIDLTATDLTGAQLGAKQKLFALSKPAADALKEMSLDQPVSVPLAVQHDFEHHKITLRITAQVTMRIPAKNWIIQSGEDHYTITADASTNQLIVFKHGSSIRAATMSQATLYNTIFTNANLYAVNMAQVRWYGEKADGSHADLEGADLSSALLFNTHLSQAMMFGATLNEAQLIMATLSQAILKTSVLDKAVSMVGAELQGANFDAAQIVDTTMTGAAVALADGVPLGTLPVAYEHELSVEKIVSYLKEHRRPNLVGATATLSGGHQSWTITNSEHKKIYSIKPDPNDPKKLAVYKEPSNAHVFSMSAATYKTYLAHSKPAGRLLALFQRHHISAHVTIAVNPETPWKITNTQTGVPGNPTVVYQTIQIKKEGNVLQMYGFDKLWLKQLPEQGLIAFGTTTSIQNAINKTTICPNGSLYSEYPRTYTLNQIMTARQ